MFKVYEVTASTGDDGRGSRIVGYFSDPKLAEAKTEKAGSWGEKGWVREITVYEPSDETPEAIAQRTREAALKKLTPDERRALGLQ
jgi:hypothetical protein